MRVYQRSDITQSYTTTLVLHHTHGHCLALTGGFITALRDSGVYYLASLGAQHLKSDRALTKYAELMRRVMEQEHPNQQIHHEL